MLSFSIVQLKEKLSQEMSKNEKLNRKLQGDPSVVRFDKRLSDERVVS